MYFIDPRQSYTYFNSTFTLKKSSQGWYSFKCPFCSDLGSGDKHAVHFQYGVTKCWVCGYKESIVDFVADYENIAVKDAKKVLRGAKMSSIDFAVADSSSKVIVGVKTPVGYHSILDGEGAMADRARKYLSGRGFDLKVLDRMGIGYCFHDRDDIEQDEDYFGYIIIPFTQEGKLLYYIGRDYIGNFLRYKNPAKATFGIGKGDLLFNEDALFIYDEVYLLEGWADALTLGGQGVSTQGWSFSSKQISKILKSPCKRLVFVPDAGADNTGETFYDKAIKVAMLFIEHKEVMVIDLSIIGSGKDVNEMGKEVVMELKEKTELLTVESATKILFRIMKRDPSLHLRRSDLIDILNTIDYKKMRGRELADELFNRAVGKQITNRYLDILNKGSKTKTKVKRSMEADTGVPEATVERFNKVLTAYRQKVNKFGKVRPITKSSSDYLMLKEIAKLASDFVSKYEISNLEEGFKEYIEIGYAMMRKYQLNKFKYYDSKIHNIFEDKLIVLTDSDKDSTRELYGYWVVRMLEYTGMENMTNIEQDYSKYSSMVLAREEADKLEADYDTWVIAQFEGLSFLNAIPNLTQFYGDGAVSRYERYLKDSVEYEEETIVDYYEDETDD